MQIGESSDLVFWGIATLYKEKCPFHIFTCLKIRAVTHGCIKGHHQGITRNCHSTTNMGIVGGKH